VVDLLSVFWAGVAWERNRVRDLRGVVFRVSSNENIVIGVAAGPVGAVARCIGIADASLSLSLSLVRVSASQV
jgi:hypothetical protein